ncbi:hypothetical protein [Acinetobacter sp. MD2]|uniref:hypothetical protein n=1 Tax=Acinetobacter sp. MD2 TaxID=2600066 RepID=UPI002D1F183D|nr:hypothetical protein [Acinetobacter sp. MD2]MEB3768328.1 hypothetical protein [Acinetobacter sp. MD2]
MNTALQQALMQSSVRYVLKMSMFFYLSMSSPVFAAQETWQQLYKSKDLALYLDRGVIFDQKQRNMLVWVKNVQAQKIIYTQYLVQCKPTEQFKIVNVNAKDKQTGKGLDIRLGEQPNKMHRAPAKSPAEYVVNAICGNNVVDKKALHSHS